MTTDAEYELMEARADREIDRMSAENERLSAELRNATADRAALDVAVKGLRELETKFDDARQAASEWIDPSGEHVAAAYDRARADASALLDLVGMTRE